MTIYLSILLLAASLIGIFWAADRMLLNAVAVANHFRIPPLIVGALIIGFGTSAPELVISSTAAFKDSLEIAIGNALGSNIANIALVLGAAAAVSGLAATRAGMHLKFVIVLAAAALPGLLLLDQYQLERSDGVILLVALVIAIYLLIKTESDATLDDAMLQSAARQKYAKTRLVAATGMLLAASYLAVWSALTIAQALGIPELIVGLTVIALGTSLPELAAALVGAYRKQHAIALGSILGSNLFNSLAVIGLPALIAPARVPPEVLSRDYTTVLGLTALLWLLFIMPPRFSLGRVKGGVLLVCFILYQAMLYREALN